jgi:uncharacterized protein YndB with AHSA1/START domain
MTLDVAVTPVRKSVMLKTDPAHAFAVFTSGIDRWWPKDKSIGNGPVKRTIIEPRKGGRWYTEHDDGSEATTGHVLVWEPPSRVVFSWEISADWKPEANRAYASEVEIRFTPRESGTLVELEHRNFERMPDGGARMRSAVEGGWTGILALAVQAAEGQSSL